jgi:hypothetical protein
MRNPPRKGLIGHYKASYGKGGARSLLDHKHHGMGGESVAINMALPPELLASVPSLLFAVPVLKSRLGCRTSSRTVLIESGLARRL